MSVISIIVPVYNVEKYLDRCIKSILEQTFKDFELILIDDGSTDGSGKMCDEYLKMDSRIKVVHKENGGQGSARNVGIEMASGEYIGFVDSDDYIDADMYELLYNNLVKENADMSICGEWHCYKDKPPKKNKPYYAVLNTEDTVRLYLEIPYFSVGPCDKLYKKIIFDEIRYPVNKSYEDLAVIFEIIFKCRKIVITFEQKYYYYHRENSTTTCRSAARHFDYIEEGEKVYNLITSHYPYMRKMALGKICVICHQVLSRVIISDDEDMFIDKENEIIRFLRRNILNILFAPKLSVKTKMLSIILFFNKMTYKKIRVKRTRFAPSLYS